MTRIATWTGILAFVLAGFLIVTAQTPTTPTRITDAAVAPPPTSFTAIWVVTPTGKVLVQPDASIRINLTANPPTISAAGLLAIEKLDQFVAASGQSAFPLTSAPDGSPVKVYRNGLLQWKGADYSLAGQVVTFLPAQSVGPGDYIQVLYWK